MAGGWPSSVYEFLLFGFKQGWAMVPAAKLASWYLLMIISGVLVNPVNRPRPMEEAAV